MQRRDFTSTFRAWSLFQLESWHSRPLKLRSRCPSTSASRPWSPLVRNFWSTFSFPSDDNPRIDWLSSQTRIPEMICNLWSYLKTASCLSHVLRASSSKQMSFLTTIIQAEPTWRTISWGSTRKSTWSSPRLAGFSTWWRNRCEARQWHIGIVLNFPTLPGGEREQVQDACAWRGRQTALPG